MKLAVVGAHLSGLPLNAQLTDRSGVLVRKAHTAPFYRFFALPGTTPPKPGLLRVAARQANGIEIEVWEIDGSAFGSFIELVPAPLCIGSLELDDGSVVKGFLVEAHATEGATEITAFGGWRAYLASLSQK